RPGCGREGDAALADALGTGVVPGWTTFTGALEHATPGPWGTHLFLAGDPAELVGWGGFKGPPVDGVVELGYEIAEARQGRGLATAAVRAMLAQAFGAPEVQEVIAHTLAERNASNRVLEKAGFAFAREAEEDGQAVWRFSLRREPTPPPGSPPRP
ncbi:MAG TPA: GNAT family N-acetyltransferase, partial [Thermoleophilaceae bacterium]|nr:GNAT family N-acetyltransferase [Thermoleophilaceae bacterium]